MNETKEQDCHNFTSSLSAPSSSNTTKPPVPQPSSGIKLTSEHLKALDLFESKANLLITGAAGTGKTTLLSEIINRLQPSDILQCAPTGTASLHLPNGYTLHSAFKIPVGTFPKLNDIKNYYSRLRNKHMTKPKNDNWFTRLQNAKIIIIDEVSMVSAWMLETIDTAIGILKNNPEYAFGGMQVIFVGDFLQLPPVYDKRNTDTPTSQGDPAYKSSVWSALNVQVVELVEVFRQENKEFANTLNIIRKGQLPKGHQFKKFQELLNKSPPSNALHICYKKNDVKDINKTKLDAIRSSCHRKTLSDEKTSSIYPFPYFEHGKLQDDLDDITKMVKENLNIDYDCKTQHFIKGMRVMLVRNVTIEETKLVNGDTGCIIGFDQPPKLSVSTCANKNQMQSSSCRTLAEIILENYYARYKLKDFANTVFPVVCFDRFPQDEFLILPSTWGRHDVDSIGDLIVRAEVDAIPLIAAWAITSHRAQGSTISDIPVHINADCMQFTEGSFYVAISRCKEFSQLSISNFKGFKQSKESIHFYDGLFTLPKPKVYLSAQDQLNQFFNQVTKGSSNVNESSSSSSSSSSSFQSSAPRVSTSSTRVPKRKQTLGNVNQKKLKFDQQKHTTTSSNGSSGSSSEKRYNDCDEFVDE